MIACLNKKSPKVEQEQVTTPIPLVPGGVKRIGDKAYLCDASNHVL